MITVFVRERGGITQIVEAIRPEWLAAGSGVMVWVDLAAPTPEEERLLAEVFHFHPLSVEDAQSALQFPKVETYPDYLYVVLHGIDVEADTAGIATRDVDFFVGVSFLVTVHDGGSRSIARLRSVCGEHAHILAEGPVALMHRIVDTMVDNYRPAMTAIETRIETLEDEAFQGQEHLVRQVLHLRR